MSIILITSGNSAGVVDSLLKWPCTQLDLIIIKLLTERQGADLAFLVEAGRRSSEKMLDSLNKIVEDSIVIEAREREKNGKPFSSSARPDC